MKPDEQTPSADYTQPVAYDTNGQPLYAHPPQQAPANPIQPTVVPVDPRTLGAAPVSQVVHMSRAIDPAEPELSDEAKKRHEDSMRKFPFLNLSRGEYVINMVQRHPIGLVLPISFTALMIILVFVGVAAYPGFAATTGLPDVGQIILPAFLLALLFGIGGYIAVWVYLQNKFFLTNESVIQEIQTSLFSRHEQTVSLGSIEDASFRQQGVIQSLFNYGSIRLSTEGEETTYRFHYVANPKKQIAVLNNAVENFKNGRPVTGD
ncbi:MAG: hypothetical protein EOO17_03605 [Chloroflexi bacterium]|nr:MAG: hypothetical protein EOO17_03605 [Chloroflexota bacterium]